MEIKTIEVLQQEAAEELNYANWSFLRQCHNYNLTDYDNIWKTLLHRYESQFQPNTDLVTAEICVLRERVAELEEAVQEFCDRVDKSEVRSKRTYDKFKSLINKGKDNGI